MNKWKLQGKAALWAIVLVALAAAGGWFYWSRQGSSDSAEVSAKPAAGASSGAVQGGSGKSKGGGGQRGPGSGGGAAQPVSVAQVRKQDIRVTVPAIGTLTASNLAVVRAQVSGTLQSLLFKEGQQVKAGQQLAQIDPRAFEAAVAQAEGNLARDSAQLENARIDLKRYTDLMAKDAIARQQLDTQDALVRQLDGTVKADKGSLENAKLQLSYTRVYAPISGRVGLKQVDLGNVVQPSDANGIVSIAQTRPIQLVFSIPSANLPKVAANLKKGLPMQVDALSRADGSMLAGGKVATMDNTIDQSTDTIRIKAIFPNNDDVLFPNQAVSVRLQLDTIKDTLAVPQVAVLRASQGFYVYVINADNTVSTRTVSPGVVDGSMMAVDGDIKPADTVVIDGIDRLREGAKVEVISKDAKVRDARKKPASDKPSN